MVLVYTNRVVPPGLRFVYWYQYVEFWGSIGLIAIPVAIWVLRIIIHSWKKWRSRPRKIKSSWTAKAYLSARKSECIVKEKAVIPGGITTFGMFFGQDNTDLFGRGFELLVLDESSVWRFQKPRLPSIAEQTKHETSLAFQPPKVLLCLLRPPKVDPNLSHEQRLAAVFDRVKPLQTSPNFAGLILPANLLPKTVFNDFLTFCSSLNTTIFIQSSPPFTDIVGIDFGLTDGVIFENATIHSDGERRDFFQAAELRHGLGRCARQRETKPHYFIGFHDLWDTRPEPAIIRRAFKMAKFYGATLQVGPSKGLTDLEECIPIEMCLSGFDWLKRADVINLHKAWIEETNIMDFHTKKLDLNILGQYVPGIVEAFETLPIQDEDEGYFYPDLNPILPTDYVADAPKRKNMWTHSSLNDLLSPVGCYDIGEEIMQEHFDSVLKTQEHLREINMLHDVTDAQLSAAISSYRRLLAFYSTSPRAEIIRAFVERLMDGRIAIYQGLDTGFAVPDHEARLWAVSKMSRNEGNEKIFIYISLRAPDFNGTLLHTYLAHYGVTREQRFEYEIDLARSMDPNLPFNILPPRVKAELRDSTYAELLTMLSQLQICPRTPFLDRVELICRDWLVRDASRLQWRELHSRQLLKGDATRWEVLNYRLTWYKRKGAKFLPNIARLERLFEIVDNTVVDALYDIDREMIDVLTKTLISAFDGPIDINADLFALMVFCAFRKYAFQDVYLEATDRCPLFHQQTDQAGVFAELWVLGSQCEIYFDVTPRALGEVIWHRYRDYLKHNLPPPESWNNKDLYTAYLKIEDLGMQEAIVEEKKKRWTDMFTSKDTVEGIKKYGYLSIFCIPAIVDVSLLTFVGRGLYLTAFMGDVETLMGTYALLTALVMCAGVTGWVGSGGGFYLFNFAFDSLNHFMVARFTGGLILSTIVSIFSFIAYGLEYGWYGGAIFVAYFNFLSPYLNLLGILATMHRNGAPLPSGRLALAKCMFVLIIAPIVTIFVNGHDVAIYLPLLYLFLFLLFLEYRKLCIQWSTWLDTIVMIDDNKIVDWYLEQYEEGDKTKAPKDEGEKSTLLVKARALLLNRVLAEDRRLYSKEKGLVKDLANGYHESVWLLQKDSNGGPIPEPYTSTWHVQLKVSLNTQRLFIRGLKEHSPFILFRYSKYDIGQNVAVFLIALLDRWVSLAMSANGYVLNLYIEFSARYGIAFSLLYFLSGAVALDSHLQHCWIAVLEKVKRPLANTDESEQSLGREQGRKRALYYTALFELILLLVFLFGIFTVLLWLFVSDKEQTILFFSYCYGYTMVLFFQFNRVFTREVRLYVWALIFSALVGFFVGVALHSFPILHLFRYNDIVALSTASTLAGILTYALADFSPSPVDEAQDTQNVEKTNWKLYSQKLIGLQTNDQCLKVTPPSAADEYVQIRYFPGNTLSDKIEKRLSYYNPSTTLTKGLPALSSYRALALEKWRSGSTSLYLTSAKSMKQMGADLCMAIGVRRDIKLDIYAMVPGISPYYVPEEQTTFVADILAESLLHETCEAVFALGHSDATLVETCVADHEHKYISNRIKTQLEHSDMRSITRICERTNVEVLKHLTFNVPVSTTWIQLPEDVRELIVARIANRSFYPTPDIVNWLGALSNEPWRIVYDRYTLRLKQCLAIHRMASAIFRRDIQPRPFSYISRAAFSLPDLPPTDGISLQQITLRPEEGFIPSTRRGIEDVYQGLYTAVKYVAILSSAGSDAGRELWWTLRHTYGRSPILWVSLCGWRISRNLRALLVRAFLLHHRPLIDKLIEIAKHGIPRTLTNDTITVHDPQNPMTGFLAKEADGRLKIEVHTGIVTASDAKTKVATAEYDEQFRLRTLSGKTVINFNYEDRKIPMSKSVMTTDRLDKIYYDQYGRESHGSLYAGGREWYFEYLYSSTPVDSRNILKGRFTSLEPDYPGVYSIYWCIIPSQDDGNTKKWRPYEKITRLVYSFKGQTWDTTWTYNHQRHPTLSTVLIEHGEIRFMDKPSKEATTDVYGFFKKPTKIGFEWEDLLFYHNPKKYEKQVAVQKRFFKYKSTVFDRAPTARLRSLLWQEWAKQQNLDAVSACYIDELVLREEPLLRPYWKLRDAGHFRRANKYLRSQINIIAATIEVTDDVSQNTFLSIKMGDLLTMGTAKDANHITLRPEDCVADTHDQLSVMFLDTGCWPDAPGGVSNCRRDLVNGHTTIRNHVLAESANDYGVPRYQVERNVNSLKVLPLWGLDGKTPFHGMFDNLLDAQVEQRIRNTSTRDIVQTFIPLISTIVKGARMKKYTDKDIIQFSNAFLNINKYFEEKDYNKTWRSKEVLRAWQDAWLKPYDDPNITNVNHFFEIEKPTLSHLDEALELWICYFFVYSVKLPESTPLVFQSTHHGVGSLYGMLLKLRRGVTWGIWDHAIMWRESCLNVSTAQCLLPIPVQNMLLGVMKLAAHVAYTHADVILPCTSVYNPDWEADLGTDFGDRAAKKEFRRKIDPVTNGIGNMESFQPVTECISKEPTCVMLSNVQFIKDVKNAVQAADVIINTFGFKNYHLTIYGAMDRTPAYTVETQQIISSRGLSELVRLGGFGSPKTVLKEAWLFMNSSLSEGLPLAIGEAALSGIPIVATEVGATAQVLTDPDDPNIRYGEVVPPNDPVALARAQISLLAMLGPWTKYTTDETPPPPLPESFTPHDVEWITKRMYDKAADRTKLGLRLRDVVLRSFHGDRYLREHEQMYWAQSHLAKQRRDPGLQALAVRQNKFWKTKSMRVEETSEVGGMWEETKWQEFEEGESLWRRIRGGGGFGAKSRREERGHSLLVQEV